MGTGKIIQADNINGVNVVKNYISNGLASNNTAGWATYADAAGTRPVNGTGGVANVTFTRSTTSPLSDAASFIFTKDAANRQGQGASYDFTIDSKDQARVLKIEFDYLVNSGTFVAGSSTTDSDVIVYLYDVTNATLIEPSSFKLLSNSTTVSDRFSGTFQTPYNSTSYRLILHCASTSASAYSLKIDNVMVSPSQYVYGTPVTDWQSYTPTGGWVTDVTYKGKWRRVGDSLEGAVTVEVNNTLSGTTGLSVTLPSGLTIDDSKLPTNENYLAVGTGAGVDVSAGNTGYSFLSTRNAFSSIIRLVYQNSTTGTHAPVTQTGPITWAAGDRIQINFKIPILGWSSSVQMSDGYEGRVIAAKATATTVPTGPLNGSSAIIFPVSTHDTTGSYSTSTGLYTVPSEGYYRVSGQVIVEGTEALDNFLTLSIYRNTTNLETALARVPSASISSTPIQVSSTVYAQAGQTISLRANTNIGTPSFTSGSVNHWFTVEKLSGSSTTSATARNSARYYSTAGSSIPDNTITYIDFGTKDYDDFGSVTGAGGGNSTTAGIGWKFVAQEAGVYHYDFKAMLSDATLVDNTGRFFMTVNKNTTSLGAVSVKLVLPNLNEGPRLQNSGDIQLNVGEYIQFGVLQSNGAARTLSSTAGNVSVNIHKVK